MKKRNNNNRGRSRRGRGQGGRGQQGARNPASSFQLAKPLKRRYVGDMAYVDYMVSSNPSTSITSYGLLVNIWTSTGLLQQFPAHSTPAYQNGNFLLRQRLLITHMEADIEMIGSQSNTIAAADLFNQIRFAIWRAEAPVQQAPNAYLTGVVTGPNITDVAHVYCDNTIPLPSQAFDSSSNYNVPMVRHMSLLIPVNHYFTFYSTTASGSGSAWHNEEGNIYLDVVSDSSVSPNPSFNFNIRVFFKFMSW